MKKITIILFLISITNVFSQETYLDKISQETCAYLTSKEMDSVSNEEKITKLGVFIIGLYNKYEKELAKEGLKIDFSNGAEGGSNFGERVGVNMVKFCPEVLVALSETVEDSNNRDKINNVEGEIVKLQEKEFSTLIIKDNNGKTQKFLWFSNFKGSERLINNPPQKGERVVVSYKNIECYSPQLKEYISRKQITEIKYLRSK